MQQLGLGKHAATALKQQLCLAMPADRARETCSKGEKCLQLGLGKHAATALKQQLGLGMLAARARQVCSYGIEAAVRAREACS